MKILLADDSAALRKIIRAALESMGEHVLEAADGQDALEWLRTEEVDLALIDRDMPRLDGIGFLKGLQREGRELAVIMVMNEPPKEDVKEALRWGARDILVKPFDLEELREKVREARSETFLERLPEDLAMEIRALGTPAAHPAGTVLVSAGRKVNLLHVLLQGHAELIPAEGAPRTRRAGDCFGERAFLDDVPSAETVRARGAVLVLSLGRASAEDLLRRRPEVGAALRRESDRHGE